MDDDLIPIISCRDPEPEATNRDPQATAFLDRDGVLNIDHGYVSRKEDFMWVEGAMDAIAWLREIGFQVIIVTNQSGIGRGYYSEGDFLGLMEWVLEQVQVDAVFYCACSPESGCPWRKPGVGMLSAADRRFPVDRERSFMVGDKDSDLEAAETFGVRPIAFHGGNLLHHLQSALA